MQISLDEQLSVQCYTWDIVDSNAYLITEKNKGLLIDAVDLSDLYQALEKLDCLTIVLTHCHFDHICGLNEIRKQLGKAVHVICTEKCSDKIGRVFKNMSSTANVFLSFYSQGKQKGNYIRPFVCDPADTVFTKRELIQWGNHSLELIPVYGHTDDGAMIIFDGKWLFSGDTLLMLPTTTRFPSGSLKRFREEDIPCLEELVGTIQIVLPGHGDQGSIEEMISINKTLLYNRD